MNSDRISNASSAYGSAAPARQRRRVDLRVVRRQVQAAIGRQPFEQDVAEAALAPGRPGC